MLIPATDTFTEISAEGIGGADGSAGLALDSPGVIKKSTPTEPILTPMLISPPLTDTTPSGEIFTPAPLPPMLAIPEPTPLFIVTPSGAILMELLRDKLPEPTFIVTFPAAGSTVMLEEFLIECKNVVAILDMEFYAIRPLETLSLAAARQFESRSNIGHRNNSPMPQIKIAISLLELDKP
jgi:hypothetical protein